MRGTPYVHGDFRGGLNTKAANYLLEDSQCRDCLNVQSTTTGAIVKRAGIQEIALSGTSIPSALKSLHVSEATGNDIYIAATDSALYKITDAGVVSSIGSGFANGNWSMVEATAQDSQGPVFLSNGDSPPKEYDGTTLADWTMDSSSTLGSVNAPVPNGKYLLMHESRVIVAGVSSAKSTIYWSEVQVGTGTLPRRWMIENQQLFDPDDGDEITGIGKVGSNLLVFKKHKVFVVYDINTGASRRLTTNIGCVSHRSIVETPFGTMFLSDNGVYVTNGSSVDLVSDQITPTIQNLSVPSRATGAFYRNHYYLSYPDAGIVLDYDLGLKSWWKHDMGVTDFDVRFNGASEELYCVLGQKLGKAFTGWTDFGTAYQWYWKGPWLAPGQAREVYPAIRKRLRAVRVDGSGSCSLKIAKDFSTAENLVTPQNADGTPRASLFPSATGTYFGDKVSSGSPPYQGTYFGDYYTTTNPPSPYLSSTIFGDVQEPQQSRVWGQGVARSWSLVFGDTTTPTAAAATIQNYTIFMQERNQ